MILTKDKQNELQTILNEIFKDCNKKQVEECKVKVYKMLQSELKMRKSLADEFINKAIENM